MWSPLLNNCEMMVPAPKPDENVNAYLALSSDARQRSSTSRVGFPLRPYSNCCENCEIKMKKFNKSNWGMRLHDSRINTQNHDALRFCRARCMRFPMKQLIPFELIWHDRESMLSRDCCAADTREIWIAKKKNIYPAVRWSPWRN